MDDVGPLRYLHGDVVLVPATMADELLELLGSLVTRPGPRPSRDVLELLQALALAAAVSPTRSNTNPPGRVEGVDVDWLPTEEAADRVGYSPRRVQQLCASGAIRHRVVGKRTFLIDVDDLQRHVRREEPR